MHLVLRRQVTWRAVTPTSSAWPDLVIHGVQPASPTASFALAAARLTRLMPIWPRIPAPVLRSVAIAVAPKRGASRLCRCHPRARRRVWWARWAWACRSLQLASASDNSI